MVDKIIEIRSYLLALLVDAASSILDLVVWLSPIFALAPVLIILAFIFWPIWGTVLFLLLRALGIIAATLSLLLGIPASRRFKEILNYTAVVIEEMLPWRFPWPLSLRSRQTRYDQDDKSRQYDEGSYYGSQRSEGNSYYEYKYSNRRRYRSSAKRKRSSSNSSSRGSGKSSTGSEKEQHQKQDDSSNGSSTSKTHGSTRSPYDILGVSSEATEAEIKAAYRRLILINHPDKVSTMDPAFQELAHRRTIEITAAYEQLTAKAA